MLLVGELGLGFDFGGLVSGVDGLVSGRLRLIGLGYLTSPRGRGPGFTSLGVLVFVLAVDTEVVESVGDTLAKFGLISSLLSSTGFLSGSGVTGLLSTAGGVRSTRLASLTGRFLTGAGTNQLLGLLNILFVGGGQLLLTGTVVKILELSQGVGVAGLTSTRGALGSASALSSARGVDLLVATRGTVRSTGGSRGLLSGAGGTGLLSGVSAAFNGSESFFQLASKILISTVSGLEGLSGLSRGGGATGLLFLLLASRSGRIGERVGRYGFGGFGPRLLSLNLRFGGACFSGLVGFAHLGSEVCSAEVASNFIDAHSLLHSLFRIRLGLKALYRFKAAKGALQVSIL